MTHRILICTRTLISDHISDCQTVVILQGSSQTRFGESESLIFPVLRVSGPDAFQAWTLFTAQRFSPSAGCHPPLVFRRFLPSAASRPPPLLAPSGGLLTIQADRVQRDLEATFSGRRLEACARPLETLSTQHHSWSYPRSAKVQGRQTRPPTPDGR